MQPTVPSHSIVYVMRFLSSIQALQHKSDSSSKGQSVEHCNNWDSLCSPHLGTLIGCIVYVIVLPQCACTTQSKIRSCVDLACSTMLYISTSNIVCGCHVLLVSVCFSPEVVSLLTKGFFSWRQWPLPLQITFDPQTFQSVCVSMAQVVGTCMYMYMFCKVFSLFVLLWLYCREVDHLWCALQDGMYIILLYIQCMGRQYLGPLCVSALLSTIYLYLLHVHVPSFQGSIAPCSSKLWKASCSSSPPTR